MKDAIRLPLAFLVIATASGFAPAADPVSHWTFDGTLEDSVGTNDAVFTAIVSQEPTYVTGFDGTPGGAIRFDGVDFVRVLPTVREAMTITCWVRLGTPQAMLGDGSQFYMGAGLVQGERPGCTLDFGLAVLDTVPGWGYGCPDVTIKGANSIVSGMWTHVAAVRDLAGAPGPAQMRLYVNGVLEAQGNNATVLPLTAPDTLAIGGHILSTEILVGDMDDVRFYSYPLTDAEIADLASGVVGEICDNGTDDDGDTLIDCADPGCAQAPNCKVVGVGPFVRGDCNGDGRVTGQVTDAVFLLNYNFLGGSPPPCSAACDINGDGAWMGQVTDAVYILNYNFLGGLPPPAPFPACGLSTLESDETLGCTTPTPAGNCP